MKVQPKKSLGQHFLKDRTIASRIAELPSGQDADYVVEIGPGMGVLTQPLLERFGEKLHVVEVDRESVDYLDAHFPDLGGRIHYQDFLKLDLQQSFPGNISVIGNFPYNISSQILFHLLKFPSQVTEVCWMFQREVARRVTSSQGTKEYGILSVLLEYYFSRHYEFTVHENVFVPPPKVKSGVIRLERKQHETDDQEFERLVLLVKAAFNQRRKMIRNSLSGFFPKEIMDQEIFTRRPEQMGLSDFLNLVKING